MPSISGKIFSPTSRVVVSKVVAYDGDDVTIIKAKARPVFQGNITWFLSADNGTHWEHTEINVWHTFTNPNTKLKWKAILTGPGTEITDIHIDYVTTS